MIWEIKGDESHEIMSSNMFENEEEEIFEVWITRPNGKNLKVFVHEDKDEAKLFKEALDYAIKTGEKTFTVE